MKRRVEKKQQTRAYRRLRMRARRIEDTHLRCWLLAAEAWGPDTLEQTRRMVVAFETEWQAAMSSVPVPPGWGLAGL